MGDREIPSKPMLPIPDSSLMIFAESAEALLLGSEEVGRCGKANLGVYKHLFRRLNGEIVAIVEKRVSNSRIREIALCQELKVNSYDDLPRANCPLPTVYNVVRGSSHTSIFMQYCPGLGFKPKKPLVYGSLLARALLDLAACDLSLPPSKALDKELRRNLMTAFYGPKCLLNYGYLRLHLQVIRLCINSLPLLRRLPVVISHNDLHSRNICLDNTGKQACLFFIDLGLVSMNYAGADFRNILAKSFFDKERKKRFWSRAYRVALGRYSLGLRCDPALIALSAHCYALLRWLKACRIMIQEGQRKDQIDLKLSQGFLLYESAHSILNDFPGLAPRWPAHGLPSRVS